MADIPQIPEDAWLDEAYPIINQAIIYANKALNEYLSTASKVQSALDAANAPVPAYKTSFLKTGKNLFNSSTVSGTRLNEADGTEVIDSNYYTSDYIPVTANVSIAITKSRKVVQFDKNKKYLTGYDAGDTASVLTPTVDGFIKITILRTSITATQVEVGTTNTAYEKFGFKFENFKGESVEDNSLTGSKLKDNDLDGKRKLKDGSITIAKTAFFVPGKNLFDNSAATSGYYMKEDGVSIASASYFYSDYMAVKSGVSIALSTCRKVTVYDSSKAVKTAQGIDNSSNGPSVITPAQDGYIIVSALVSNLNSLQVEVGTVSTAYETFGIKTTVPLLNASTANLNVNPLYGKSLLGFGDSIVRGAGNNDIGIVDIIGANNNMTVNNKAVSGATISSSTTKNILTQVNNAITAAVPADYIVFDGLANDIAMDSTVVKGSISEGYTATLDENTFCGAFESICKKLKLNWMAAKIIYVRVHNMNTRDLALQKEWGELAVQMCQKWSIPVVDLFNEGGLNTWIFEMKKKYTYDTYGTGSGDGTHPNADGYNTFYVPRITAKLKIL